MMMKLNKLLNILEKEGSLDQILPGLEKMLYQLTIDQLTINDLGNPESFKRETSWFRAMGEFHSVPSRRFLLE